MALTDFQSLVADLIRDDAEKISTAQRDTAIAVAVARYGKDRPRQKVEDITAPGGNLLPFPSAWVTGISDLDMMETPLGEVPPSFVPGDAWSYYDTPSGTEIMLASALATGATVRMTFSIPHQVDDAGDTIPLHDREAVCCLAAASLCDQLASLFSGDTDSTIQADSVNHQSKASEFAARARALRKRYFDELGIDTKANVAGGAVVTLKPVNSLGEQRLTHGSAYKSSRRRF